MVLDLRAGRAVQQFRNADFGGRVEQHWQHALANLTPDGRYLFTMSDTGQLVRFRIDGQTILFEEISDRIADNGKVIDVSPDGSLVCLPSGGGNNENIENHPRNIGPYSTYVYNVRNIRKPKFVIRQGPYPRTVAFDPEHYRIFSQNHTHNLMMFDEEGTPQEQFTLEMGQTRQILPHPQRNGLLLLSDKGLYWVDFADSFLGSQSKASREEMP